METVLNMGIPNCYTTFKKISWKVPGVTRNVTENELKRMEFTINIDEISQTIISFSLKDNELINVPGITFSFHIETVNVSFIYDGTDGPFIELWSDSKKIQFTFNNDEKYNSFKAILLQLINNYYYKDEKVTSFNFFKKLITNEEEA